MSEKSACDLMIENGRKTDWEIKNNDFVSLYPSCPICGYGTRKFVWEMTNGRLMAKEACGNCDFLSAPLPKRVNASKRTNSKQGKWALVVAENCCNRCAICGEKSSLEAHHIFPVSLFPEYRYLISNGILLCRECHKSLHNRLKIGVTNE